MSEATSGQLEAAEDEAFKRESDEVESAGYAEVAAQHDRAERKAIARRRSVLESDATEQRVFEDGLVAGIKAAITTIERTAGPDLMSLDATAWLNKAAALRALRKMLPEHSSVREQPADVDLDAAISETARAVRLGDVLAARGVITVALDDEDRLTRYHPDGTPSYLDDEETGQ